LFTLLQAHNILDSIRIFLQIRENLIPIDSLELGLLSLYSILVLLDPFLHRHGFAFQLVLLFFASLYHVFIILVLLIQVSLELCIDLALFKVNLSKTSLVLFILQLLVLLKRLLVCLLLLRNYVRFTDQLDSEGGMLISHLLSHRDLLL
jgi:hypothetical protein